jgi:hypothetical protein
MAIVGQLASWEMLVPIVRQKLGWKITAGGDQHGGWFPKGATEPLPEPVREVALTSRSNRMPGDFS